MNNYKELEPISVEANAHTFTPYMQTVVNNANTHGAEEEVAAIEKRIKGTLALGNVV